MILLDSHCHLYYEGIVENLDEKIKMARLNDIKYLVTVSTNERNMLENINICQKYQNVCCSVGVHPADFSEDLKLESIKKFLNHEKVVAIGEVGLDFHFEDSTPKEKQKKLFLDMLSLSEISDLPYIIHARECFPDVFEIMSQYNIQNAVFHCYTDDLENAKKILDLGYFISFSGVITFKKADALREVVKYVPLDRILVETDSPYLAPVPYRGKTNEPAFVREVAQLSADLKEMSLEEFSKSVVENFFNLFPKAKFLLGDKA